MVHDRKTHYLRTKKKLFAPNRENPIICEQKNVFLRIKKYEYSMVRDRKTHYLRTKKTSFEKNRENPIICERRKPLICE